MRKKGRPTKTSSTMGKRKRANGNGKTDTAGARVEGTRVEYTLASLPRDLVKYWHQRYRIFSRFDEGVWMDAESWYSVTPECMARHIARELALCGVTIIVDAFCGAGGNAIAFAQECAVVYAWDTDPVKVACARHNAELYGVADRIHFQVGDFFELIKTVKEVDCVFLSPPWGGPTYLFHDIYDIECMQPYSATTLLKAARQVTEAVVLYLPRQSNQKQVAALQPPPGSVELQFLKCSGRIKALCVYFGTLATPVADAERQTLLKGDEEEEEEEEGIDADRDEEAEVDETVNREAEALDDEELLRRSELDTFAGFDDVDDMDLVVAHGY